MFVFFVSDGSGHYLFSRNFDEHKKISKMIKLEVDRRIENKQ